MARKKNNTKKEEDKKPAATSRRTRGNNDTVTMNANMQGKLLAVVHTVSTHELTVHLF